MRNAKVLKGFICAAIAAVGVTAGVARATLVGVLNSFPDVTTGYSDVNYDHTSGIFDATGYVVGYATNPSDITSNITGADTSYNIHAILNPADGSLISGTISVHGKVPDFGLNNGLLITGDLTKFGFLNGGGDIFDMKFQVTGGELAVAYAAGFGGAILDVHHDGNGVAFTGSFAQDFHNANQFEGIGNADIFPVPEPASLGLVVISLTMLGARRRHSKCS